MWIPRSLSETAPGRSLKDQADTYEKITAAAPVCRCGLFRQGSEEERARKKLIKNFCLPDRE